MSTTQPPAPPPEPNVSPSRVEKIFDFEGSLPTRALYLYLPAGYDESGAHYPVLYMHDGQNLFEAFVEDSYLGSWRADETADRLIRASRMRPCVIVGVSNGSEARLAEYLPPYASYTLPVPKGKRKGKGRKIPLKPLQGRADETFAYYRDEIAPFVAANYRVLTGREHTATGGSSLGGLFSTYIAWEHPEFARGHAILSPSYWITRNGGGEMETVERLRRGKPRDLRLWLDSGTQDSPGKGDDGMADTQAARDALLKNGFEEGPDFRYYLDEGATHHEDAWAARLPGIFEFLFPPEEVG